MSQRPNEKMDRILNELGDEYKDLLYKKLIENNKGYEDLRVADLLRLDAKIKEQLTVKKDMDDRKRKMIMTLGFTYTIFGIAIVMYFEVGTLNFKPTDIITLVGAVISIVGVLGMMVGLLSPNLDIFKPSRKSIGYKNIKNSGFIEYEIVNLWRDVESIASELSTNIGKGNLKPGETIKMLRAEKFITEEETNILKNLFSIRNSIVHHGPNQVELKIKEQALIESSKIVKKLMEII